MRRDVAGRRRFLEETRNDRDAVQIRRMQRERYASAGAPLHPPLHLRGGQRLPTHAARDAV
jgi:hypothetical protein